jgi:hypothetical protein
MKTEIENFEEALVEEVADDAGAYLGNFEIMSCFTDSSGNYLVMYDSKQEKNRVFKVSVKEYALTPCDK